MGEWEWYLKRLKLFPAERTKNAAATATNRRNICKIYCIQIRSTITILSPCRTGNERKLEMGVKRRMRAVHIDKYSQPNTQCICVCVSLSPCSQEIVFCGYVTVIYNMYVCLCAIYTDLGRGKQSFLRF